MQPDQRPPLRPHATYVMRRYKLVYVSTPKAACTTIKWMLADLQGLAARDVYWTLSPETTRATTIHQSRSKWPETPTLRKLDDEELAEITPENGWLMFTMTRHPSSRLWSAWQSKFLLREPRFRAQFKAESWLPDIPETTQDVLDDWRTFVEAVSADPETEIMQDVHFRSQSALLNIGVTPYDRVYDTSQFKLMLKEVSEHLRANGWKGELAPRRSNETPLPALASAFPDDILDMIQQLYRDDFAKLGYDDPRPPKLRDEESFHPDLIAATSIIAERGDRIGDLSRRARRAAKNLQECREANPQWEPSTSPPAAKKPPEPERRRLPSLRRR